MSDSNAQQFNQISNINPTLNTYFNLNNFGALNNFLVFSNDNDYSKGLYKSDGTAGGTFQFYNWPENQTLLENEQNYGGVLKSFYKLGNNLFFKLKNFQSGLSGLWKTDGTASGTLIVNDFQTKSFCSNLTSLNGQLFFITKYFDQVWGNTTHELWKSDGSLNGTVLVKNWVNSTNFSNEIHIISYNNKIYFEGFESDGTAIGTIQTGVNLPLENESCLYNGLIYYKGSDGKIWKTDGTLSGTGQVVNFPVEGNFYVFNGYIYFSGGFNGPGQTGNELCRTDGTIANTAVLKDIYLGFNSSNPGNFISLNNNLFFIALDGTHGNELWKTDGSSGGTILVKDIFPVSSNGFQRGFYEYTQGKYDSYHTIHNNELFFTAHGWGSQAGIWKTNGEELNTTLVQFADSTGPLIDINCRLFCALDTMLFDSFGNYHLNSELWSLIDSCSSLGLIQKEDYNSCSIYPNPTSDKISIKINDTFIKQKYFIYDQFGRIILESRFDAIENEVDLSEFHSGIYFLKVEGGNETIKIVKN